MKQNSTLKPIKVCTTILDIYFRQNIFKQFLISKYQNKLMYLLKWVFLSVTVFNSTDQSC